MTQKQVFLHGLDFGAFAGNVLGAYPEDLVTTPYPVGPLLVHRYDIDRELPPFSCFVRFQDVDLYSIIFLAILLHVDLQLSFGGFAVGIAVCRFFCAASHSGGGNNRNLYAGGNGRSALLVTFGTSIASDARHSIFAGTLPCGLITGFPSCTHGMAITCFACFPVGNWFGHVPIVTFLTVMAVTTCCVVPAIQADTSTLAAR